MAVGRDCKCKTSKFGVHFTNRGRPKNDGYILIASMVAAWCNRGNHTALMVMAAWWLHDSCSWAQNDCTCNMAAHTIVPLL